MITHGSLFSGIGACELAAERMGWKNLFHCEVDDFCNKVLDYWFPDSKAYYDVKNTDFSSWRGKVTVLSGGFPCQSFSLAGKRRGEDDDRYLWPYMLRAVRQIKPDYVLGENVIGLTSMVQPSEKAGVEAEASLFSEDDRIYISMEQQYVLERIITDLETEGYSVQTFVIPACAVEAVHRRDRVWIVGKREKEAVDADTISFRRDEGIVHDGISEEPQEKECREIKPCGADSPHDKWREYFSEPLVYRADDEIPQRLSGSAIPFKEWAAKAIKAYGNSMVPDVVYEIFLAIQADIDNDRRQLL